MYANPSEWSAKGAYNVYHEDIRGELVATFYGKDPRTNAVAFIAMRNALPALLDAADERDRLAEEVKRYKALAHDLTGMTWADRARKERERAEHAEMEVAALCGGDYDRLRAHLDVAVKALEVIADTAPGEGSHQYDALCALATIRSGQQEGNGND